jgi:hypothetical protein
LISCRRSCRAGDRDIQRNAGEEARRAAFDRAVTTKKAG